MSESDTEDGGSKPGPKRPGGKRPRPPVTIDLTAAPAAATSPEGAESPPEPGTTADPPADAASEPAAKASVPPLPSPAGSSPPRSEAAAASPSAARPVSPFPPRAERPKTDWSSAGRLIAAGVFGGAIATVLGILYHASGIIPTRADLTAAEAVRQAQAVAQAVSSFEDRLAAAESAVAALPALTEKVTALEKLEETNRSRIENLENGMPMAGGAVALGPVEARITAVESTLATLGGRLDSLGGQVEEIVNRPSPAEESERAARAIAIGLLRQGAGSGEGFAADLAMLKALGMDGGDVAALEPLAVRGAPTIAALQAAFPPVADAILASEAEIDPDAGFLDRVVAFGRGLVTIRPTTPIEGDTVAAIVSRMQAAVAHGDLAAALGERQRLSPEAQTVSEPWAEAAADRTAIDTIVGRLALSVAPPAN